MSEHTFFCPGRGTWVAVEDVSQEAFDEYPAGTREIDPSPGPGHVFDGLAWVAAVSSLADLRAKKLSAIEEMAMGLLLAGAPVAAGLHLALDDGSRADITAMAATATAAATGAVAWPDSYARGWITIENVRIPLATPAAGLSLAASVGNYYASVVQHRRDLKDAALAAVDAAALDAIDINAGWPASIGD